MISPAVHFTNMKQGITVLFLIFLAVGICSLEFDFQTTTTKDNWIAISSRVCVPADIDLLLNLEEGYHAEVQYQFRLYQKSSGLRALLGDKLIIARNITFTAYKHFFFERYVIEGLPSGSLYFAESDEFLNHFIGLQDFLLYQLERAGSARYYLKCRVTLVPVKLETPLHIISLFSTISKTSEWVSREIGKSLRAD